MTKNIFILLVVIIFFSGCPKEHRIPDPNSSSDNESSITDPVIPDTPAGKQLSWILKILNTQEGKITNEELKNHFTEEFITKVGDKVLLNVLVELSKSMKPVRFGHLGQDSTSTDLVAGVEIGNGQWNRIKVRTQEEEPYLIAGLLFQPAADLDPTFKSWQNFEKRFLKLGPQVSFLAVEVTAEERDIFSVNPDDILAIGSTFKLYVLAALAKSTLSEEDFFWDQLFPIRDAWKSLPSGTMQNEVEGIEFTLLKYAQNMISISDNTATDHIMHILGRDRVEEALSYTNHSNPTKTVPFLTTKEFFVLKVALTKEEKKNYIDADRDKKLVILESEEIKKKEPEKKVMALTNWIHNKKPLNIDTFEWFASARDLARVMVALKAFSELPGGINVSEVLSINPGIPFDAKVWPYVGYKGGEEPGVFQMTWLLKRSDERWFVMSMTVNNPDGPIDQAEFIYLASGGVSLLEEEDFSQVAVFFKEDID